MADIHDYLNASKETDSALNELNQLGGLLSGGSSYQPVDGPLATLHAGRVIALAIREVGTRLDYVLRDINRER